MGNTTTGVLVSDLGELMALIAPDGTAVNSFGTPVTVKVCPSCGTTFTVCPADIEGTFGDDCTGVGCPSYDPARDIDAVWDQMQERGHITREDT